MIRKTALLLALGTVVGCTANTGGEGAAVAHDPPPPGHVAMGRIDDGDKALEQVDENLARLRALDVFEVGELLVDMPEEASNCYGPCPGSEGLILEAKKKAALRLADLVAVAEPAMGEPSSYQCLELIDENLAALRALEIVEITNLIQEKPQNNPQCYNLPCQEDIDALKARHAQRAAELDNIARTAKGL